MTNDERELYIVWLRELKNRSKDEDLRVLITVLEAMLKRSWDDNGSK